MVKSKEAEDRRRRRLKEGRLLLKEKRMLLREEENRAKRLAKEQSERMRALSKRTRLGRSPKLSQGQINKAIGGFFR